MVCDQTGNGMRQLYTWVRNQAAPIARMVSTRSRLYAEVKVNAASRPQKEGGTVCPESRPVGRHQQISFQKFCIVFADILKAWRPCFLTHFDDEFGIET
jgi:hypothetical protein